MKQVEAKILENKKIKKDHYVLTVKSAVLSSKTKPGQFFNVRITKAPGTFLRRPLGAHDVGEGKVKLLYKVVGDATKALSLKKKNEIMDIIGPLGNGFDIRPKKEAILVGGGHGIAPLFFLAKKLVSKKIKTTVLIGAKKKEHVVSDEEIKKLGVKVCIATEDGTKGHKGFVTELLKKELSKKEVNIYACGPKPMLKEVARIAKENNTPCQLSLEAYMACGIGTCLGCAIKTTGGYKMVCKDGPIFDAKDVIWE